MDELIFAGNKYISSKRASKLTGYTTDYIGQMCRGDKMDCRLVGRNWYVNEEVIKAQKKSFKKEQLKQDKRAIEYSKIDMEPMYYSTDSRSNNVQINKTLTNKEDADEASPRLVSLGLKKKENLIPILNIVESPVVDLRNTNKEIIKRPTREVTKKESLLPQKSPIKLPMVRIIASVLLLAGLLFVAGTFTLEKTVHYTSSDKSLDTEYQLANVVKFFSF